MDIGFHPPKLLIEMKAMLDSNPERGRSGDSSDYSRRGEPANPKLCFCNLFYKLINKISQVGE